MKVIDLLNKIANGEEVPKILHNGKYGIYEKEKRAVAFYNDEKCTSYYGSWFKWELCEDGLNDEIEIIEEPKKIEKIKWELTKETINTVSDSNTVKITALMKRTEKLKNTLNEIIDYINKGDSNE